MQSRFERGRPATADSLADASGTDVSVTILMSPQTAIVERLNCFPQPGRWLTHRKAHSGQPRWLPTSRAVRFHADLWSRTRFGKAFACPGSSRCSRARGLWTASPGHV